MILIILAAIIILIIAICYYNSLRGLSNKVKQSKSSIDIYLTQRFDLIPNLVECVKGYMTYEEETLTKITELRTSYISNKNLSDGEELNNQCTKLLLNVEKYPELKASEQFLNLQKNITKMENQLQAARRLYNSDVTTYNTAIAAFPGVIFANIFGFKEEKLFEIEPMKSENVKVEL